MLQRAHLFFFLIILAVAVATRFIFLSSVPASLTWDEASIGYNAFAIASEHRDEWLNRMPIAFKSFGEYKAPIAIYIVAVTTKVFGLTTFAIRFPMAVAGVITVLASYVIGRFLFPEKKHALLFMLLVAVSPLNIHYSRIAFESSLSVACVAVGVAFLLAARKRPYLYIASALAFVLSLYANHATKIAVPFLLPTLGIYCRKDLWKEKKWTLIALIIGTLVILPLAREFATGKGGERFYETSVIATKDHVRPVIEIIQLTFHNYLLHFDPRFLLFGEVHSYRDGNGVFGVLSIVEFTLAALAVLALLIRPELRRKYWWIIPCILFSILPAAISEKAPHTNRIHHIIPWVQALAVVGYIFWDEYLWKKSQCAVTGVVLTALILEATWHTWVYFTRFPTVSAPDYQYGYEQVISYVTQNENKYKTILMSDTYQQAYIYLLLHKKIPPIEYHQGALNEYKIQPVSWSHLGGIRDERDKAGHDIGAMIIGTPDELPFYLENIIYEVLNPDGSVAFRVVKL